MTTPRTSGEYSAVVHDLPLLKFLPPDARDIVANAFVAASFPFGSTIVREGEAADALYVVVDGRARVLKRGENGDELSLNVLRRGDLFGEMGLLERAQRTATVRASSDVEVLRLDRSVFDALVTSRPDLRQYFELQIRHRHLHNFFRQFTAFAALPADALRELLEALAPWEAGAGELVVREGDPPGAMFFVEDGRLRVFTEGADGTGERRYVAYLRKGDFFGERAVFMDE